MARVVVPYAEGLEEVEAVTIVDVLRRGGVEVVTASIHEDTRVKGAHDIVLEADALLRDVVGDPFDAIVLPGGGKGTLQLESSEMLAAFLNNLNQRNALICAICAAPTVLAKAGVLRPDQQITCYPSCRTKINRVWVNKPVVSHNNVVTGQGPGTALLFSLVVLNHLVGAHFANQVSMSMIAGISL